MAEGSSPKNTSSNGALFGNIMHGCLERAMRSFYWAGEDWIIATDETKAELGVNSEG